MRICVGVITRNRRQMLGELLRSFTEMRAPEGCSVLFALVENDAQKSLEDLLPILDGRDVIYEIEPRPGIPVARNKVLEISLRENCDYTAFVDDDETVDPGWLVNLFSDLTTRSLDLVGGPVRLQPVGAGASLHNRMIWKGLVTRNARIERRAAARRASGEDGRVTVVTSNWLIDNRFLRETGITFDEALGMSGGSDTAFFKRARTLEAKTGWAPEALVFEEMPLSRLTTGYQYRRGRDQSIASFHNKYKSRSAGAAVRAAVFCLFRVLGGVLYLVAVPFTGGRTLTLSARSFGTAVGRLQALTGRKSSHYKTVHGT